MATKHKYNYTSSQVSFGAELELIDWPRNESLPSGMAIDEANWTSVNSNGVAVDGPGKLYHLGGEILTAPSEDPNGPSEQLVWIMNRWPETTFNYRTGLNVHVRVPGLRDDLKKLKQLQTFINRVMPELLPIIDPIPVSIVNCKTKEALKGAQRTYKVRKKDHHSLVAQWRFDLQMKARTPTEFFEAEAIHEATGKVHWAIVPRACVNLRQMLQTDTVEFRHFFMPATAEELLNTTLWCKMFMEVAFDGGTLSAQDLLKRFGFEKRAWPQCLPYDPWLDEGFHFTTRHYHKPEVVLANIKKWLTRQAEIEQVNQWG